MNPRKNSLISASLLSTALLLAGLSHSAHGAPILVDGSFESGTFAGWSTTGNVADAGGEGASNGTQAAIFNPGGDFRGATVSQSFATILNEIYTVSFDANVFGNPTSTQYILSQVTDASSNILNSTTPGLTANGFNSNGPFVTYTYQFTADSLTSTLFFQDISAPGSNGAADTILDNVSVADTGLSAVPEPSTWALMLGGLGLLAFAMRRRAILTM